MMGAEGAVTMEPVIRGFKMTDNTGHAFPTKDDYYKCEVGKEIEAKSFDPGPENAKGIYFGDNLAGVVDMGIDGSCCDPRYRTDPNLLPRDGVKVFEVEGYDAVRLDEQWKGDVKSRKIKVIREVTQQEIIEAVGREGTWRALEFVAACVPPAMLPLLSRCAQMNRAHLGGVSAGANLNPKNPDRLLPGDFVGLKEDMDRVNQATKDFFSRSRECVLDSMTRITHFAQVHNESGETYRLNVAFLKRLGPGPSSGKLPEFADDKPFLLPPYQAGAGAPSGAVKPGEKRLGEKAV
jgi:hypothetical protein